MTWIHEFTGSIYEGTLQTLGFESPRRRPGEVRCMTLTRMLDDSAWRHDIFPLATALDIPTFLPREVPTSIWTSVGQYSVRRGLEVAR